MIDFLLSLFGLGESDEIRHLRVNAEISQQDRERVAARRNQLADYQNRIVGTCRCGAGYGQYDVWCGNCGANIN